MTSNDIIKAAFKVWGRDFFKSSSLSQIAGELAVSKSALYRHFKDKDALLREMYSAYFDDFCGFIKPGFENALKVLPGSSVSGKESFLIIMRSVGEYYLRNREMFVFSLIKIFNSLDMKDVAIQFLSRGVDFKLINHGGDGTYPSMLQIAMSTLVFFIAMHHRKSLLKTEKRTENEVMQILSEIESRVTKGIGLDADKVNKIDFEKLEKKAGEAQCTETEENTLMRAVAAAVAEAGPWGASMEMVARHSGLSKSTLYAHFKDKRDMMSQFLMAEFSRLIYFAKGQIETSEVHEEQLYLAIISIVYYLRSRPEILMAIDHIKARKLNLGKQMPIKLYQTIGEIKMEAIQKYDRHQLVWIAEWILFMIVNTLALWSFNKTGNDLCPERIEVWTKNAAQVPNECFRRLFHGIALGLEGLT